MKDLYITIRVIDNNGSIIEDEIYFDINQHKDMIVYCKKLFEKYPLMFFPLKKD